MKLQHLSVIFIIIILPLILVLSTYIGLQIDTLNLQTAYNTKLNDATHDAMQAFQWNTQNNDYSTVADSLKRDVGASINTFYSSLAANMGVSGYSKEELHPYIPAVLYTMYDGYYIYSPTKTEAANNEETENLLKQYIYYSARYVKGTNTDVVINYSLDSYVSVYGMVNGEYVARSGYLIQHGSKGLTKINGEILDKYYIKVDGKTYGNTSGIKIEDGAIWNSDGSQKTIDSITYNGQEIRAEDGVVIRGENNEFIERKNVAGNSLSKEALYYYIEAYEFSKYISEVRLNEAINGATVYINKEDVVASNKISTPNNLFNLKGTEVTDDIENIKSNFVNHKREIIRLNIENNLQNAFNNYKGTVGNSYDYQLPKFEEEEWEKIYKNVSVVTFMQGIKVGSKMYNNYSIVTSTGNEEYVDPEELYFLNNSNPVNLTYHRITDSKLITTSAGYRSSIFETRNKVNGQDAGKDILSVVLGKLYTADYATIVNGKANSIYNEETGELLNGVKDTEGAELSNGKKQAYYTTLARERYELLKLRATSILNTSQKIKTKVLASAQSTTINSGQFSASLRPANQFSNKQCTYSIINTESGEVVENSSGWCDENGRLASQSINGLDLNTTYKVNVSAIDNYGRTVTDTATFTTGDIPLTPPMVQQPWLNGNPDVTITAINYIEGQELHIQRYFKDINENLTKYGAEIVVESGETVLHESDLKPENTKIEEIVTWVKDSNTGKESSTIRKVVDDKTAPVISIAEDNIVTTKDTIKFNIQAEDFESGFNEETKFRVKLFSENENDIQGKGGEYSVTTYNIKKILAENITIDNLIPNKNYYIEVTVQDRYGNIGKYNTKGENTITTTPGDDAIVPDAKVELIPDDTNNTEDDNVNPSQENTNIVVRYSPTYYVDGEENYKQGYLGSGEKVVVKLEQRIENSNYRVQYKEYGKDTWNNYVEAIEISNNTSYLVRFIDNNGIAGEPGVFNIRNIDKKEPEIRIEENTEDLSKITVIAEDSGESNSGLKVFKIEKIKFDGTKEEINPEINRYNGTDNSGDRTNGGVAYEIQGIGVGDGEEYFYKQINIIAIDCVGRETIKTINLYGEITKPVVELISVTNDNTIDKNYASKNHNIEIKFKVIDAKGNLELKDLTSDAFDIKVDGKNTTFNIENSKQDNIYTLKINNIIGDGVLEVNLKEGIIIDKIGNVNEKTTLMPNNLSNETNNTINYITIDNTAPVITLSASPEDVSLQAIEANKNGQDGKNTTIKANVNDISGIYSYTYKIEDLYGLKEVKSSTETLEEINLEEIKLYELSTTFGIYKITINNVQDRAGNLLETGKTIRIYDYTIKTKEEMELFQQYAKQGATFKGTTITLLNDIDLQGSQNNQWTPIGRSYLHFNGIFEGQDYKISGIYINTTEKFQGLFNQISESAIIKNLTVSGSITGGNYVGGIAGRNYGTIENCYNMVTVSGEDYVGGITGENRKDDQVPIIKGCKNEATITGDWYTGGIAGDNDGTIENCYNTGKISVLGYKGAGITTINGGTIKDCYNLGAVDGNNYNGGIAESNYGTIENCYNKGKISGWTAGGIVCLNTEIIKNCYNTGEISGISSVGGIASENNENGTIENCYNIGKLVDTSSKWVTCKLGGIIGENIGAITNSYYLNTSATTGGHSAAIAKTEAEMKAPEFVLTLGIENWKEDHVQDGREQINNGYPILKWQEGKETVIIETQKVTINQITVKATATDTNYSYYKYKITKDNQEIVFVEGGTNKEYTFTDLIPDTDYNIEIYAYTSENYNEAESVIKGFKQIKTLKPVEIQLSEIVNDNTKHQNYANIDNTIKLIFNENCEEEINIDSSKIKVMVDENELVRTDTENVNYTADILKENDKITVTITGIETEGKLSVLLQQGLLSTTTNRENIEILLDDKTNYGAQDEPLILDIEIDNTLPQIAIKDVNTDIIVESTTKTITAEGQIRIAEEFEVQKTYYLTQSNNTSNTDSSYMTFATFMSKLMNGETYKNTKIILTEDVTYDKSTQKVSNFAGWFDGNGHQITYSESFDYIKSGTATDKEPFSIYDSLFTEVYEGAIISNLKFLANNGYQYWRDWEGITDELQHRGCTSIARTNRGLIKDCTIVSGSSINAYMGTVAPVALNNYGIITRCTNYARVHVDYRGWWEYYSNGAGIVASNYGLIYDCENYGYIGATRMKEAAGISLYNYGDIIRCRNFGRIRTGNYYAGATGGICSYSYAGSIMKYCYNKGNVNSICYNRTCGLSHFAYSGAIIENCFDLGSITGERDSNYGLSSIASMNYVYIKDCWKGIKPNYSWSSPENNFLAGESISTINTAIKEWNKEQGRTVWLEDKNNENGGYPIFNFEDETIITETEANEYTLLIKVYDENLLSPDALGLKDKIDIKLGNNSIKIKSITVSNMETDEYALLSVKTEPITDDVGGTLVVELKENAIYDKANNTNKNIANLLNEKIKITATPKIEVSAPVIGETAILKVTNEEQFLDETINWQWYYKDGSKIEGAVTSTYELPAKHVLELEEKEIYCIGTIGEKEYTSNAQKLTIDYTITNAEELKGVRELVNSGSTLEGKTVYLGNSIELNPGFTFKEDGTYEIDSTVTTKTEPEQWTPIGNSASQFKGTFDGQGHEVKGIYINNDLSYMGFFGYIGENATIKNIGVHGTISGQEEVGGIAGYNRGTIENSYNTATISGPKYIGGIVGYNGYGAIVRNSYNEGKISGIECIGGIVGTTGDYSTFNEYGTIINCYNVGAISGEKHVGGTAGAIIGGTIENTYNTGSISGQEYVGGIVGIIGEPNAFEGYATIKNCYNAGTISGKINVGGIAGLNYYFFSIPELIDYSSIYNSYNVGTIYGNSYVGGIVGMNSRRGKVENCYNVGTIYGDSYVGGIAGDTADSSGGGSILRSSYYLNTSATTGGHEAAIAKTEAEMKAPEFVLTLGIENWKEDHTQDGREQINNGYPILKWQEGKETVILETKDVGMDSITVSATPTDASYTYYKYYITKNGETRGNTPAYTGQEKEYTFENLTSGTGYTIEVFAYKDSNYSEEDRLYGMKESYSNGPVINVMSPKVGQTATFDIVNIEELPENISIKWYRNVEATTEGSTEITGEVGSEFTETAANAVLYDGYYYYCIVTENEKEYTSILLQLKVNYTINTKAELEGVRNLVNSGKLDASISGLQGKTVYLGNDIDLNPGFTFKKTQVDNVEFTVDSTITTKTKPDTWVPINTYKGTLDGQGYTINGLYRDYNGYDNIDMAFIKTVASNAQIKNLTIDGSMQEYEARGSSTGTSNIGGISFTNNGLIQNCHNKAKVSGQNRVAGIAVYNYGTIELCSNKGLIYDCGSYSNSEMGGICCYNYNIVKKCYNKGKVISSGDNAGIASYNSGGTIEECYNAGTLGGSNNSYGFTAGISAGNSGIIKNCYNRESQSIEFGIVGENYGSTSNLSNISYCYTTTNHRICGRRSSGSAVYNRQLLRCYSVGDYTLEQMKTVDFLNQLGTASWKMDTNNINGGYPILKWQE